MYFVDADEWIAAQIAVRLADPQCAGFAHRLRLVFMGTWIRHCGWYSGSWRVQLIDRRYAKYDGSLVGERPHVDGAVRRLDNDLVDEDRKGLAAWLHKHVRYAEPENEWRAGAVCLRERLQLLCEEGSGRPRARSILKEAVSGAAAVIDDPDVSLVVIATPHDVHEELASRALAAGRDVWCEKPLALTCAGIDEVEKAWRESGRQLTLGFNRRWAPAVQAAQRVLAEVKVPKLVVYRIAAGQVPDGHWYLDRRQGGRWLGEVCHFVDLAQALVGADIEDAVGVLGGDASQGDDGVVVALRFAEGSVASVAYGSTPPVAGKERIEVLAGSQQVVIDDFRSVQVNGRTLWKGRQDKGHRGHVGAFREAVQGRGPGVPTEAMLSTMRATIQATDKARES